jgi:dTDP-4-amino-4,6-dideoxygalactose transaminase
VQLCDTRHGHFDFDPGQLKRLADARTLAILPTHLGGRIADVELACEVARSAGAWVIEDAAQALGARVGNSSVGLRGDIGFFSLAAGKGLSLHEGGLLVSRDDELRAALAEHAANTFVSACAGSAAQRAADGPCRLLPPLAAVAGTAIHCAARCNARSGRSGR